MIPYWRLSLLYFFYFAFIGTFSPYFGLYLKSLDFNAWDIGVLMSLMQVMRLAAPNVWGWLADRLGARVPIVRLASLAALAGFASLFLTERFAGLFAGLCVMAFFWTASLPLIESLTLAHLNKDPSRYGGIRLWGSVGFVAAVLSVGFSLDHLAPRAVLWAGSAFLAGIAVASVFIPEARGGTSRESGPSLREILRRPAVRRFLAASFFMSAAHGVLYVFYSLYLVGAGYSKAQVGGLWTLGVLAEIVVFFFMPQLLRRFSLASILLVSFACAAVRFAAIGAGVEYLGVLLIAQILHGATFGAHHAAAMALIHRWFGDRHQSRAQALYGSVSFGAGGMVGALVSGYSWDAIGPVLTFCLGSVFGLIGLVLIARRGREEI